MYKFRKRKKDWMIKENNIEFLKKMRKELGYMCNNSKHNWKMMWVSKKKWGDWDKWVIIKINKFRNGNQDASKNKKSKQIGRWEAVNDDLLNIDPILLLFDRNMIQLLKNKSFDYNNDTFFVIFYNRIGR